MSSARFTADEITAEVAELLGEDPATLTPDLSLLDAGMDSIRLMTLVERWARRGAVVEFPDLARVPTVAAWTALLNERAGLAGVAPSEGVSA